VPGNTDNVHESDDDDAGLDEDELEILKDAGIIARPSKTRKRRSSRHQAKHVVFVENEEEGMHALRSPEHFFVFSGTVGTSDTSVEGAICAVTSGPYVAIRRTGTRNAEADDGKGRL
jgi:hypothetical protein